MSNRDTSKLVKVSDELWSDSDRHILAGSDAIYDYAQKKNQESINSDVARHDDELHGTGGIDSKIEDLQAMEQIVIDGGEAQIAQGSDFDDPDATKRAKIPTVGAILDGLNDGIYDVSSRNPLAGPNSDGKFTLEYILNNADALIPTSWRKGGMSIKFIQSSDNKYVQYRLMADEWSIDTEDWAIAEEGVYIDNPEFVRVYTDAEEHILFGVQKDGNVFFGAGVPQQVVNYIQAQISALGLNEYEDIVTFLGNLIEGDTLTTLLYNKVDKEEGKSLIPAQYIEEVDNPEYIDVKTDSEDKVIDGTKKDGTKVIGGDAIISGDATILGNIDIQGVTYTLMQNPEWIRVIVDAQNHILCGIKADGSIYLNSLTEIPSVIQDAIIAVNTETASLNERVSTLESVFSLVDNPEYIDIKVDSEGKILESYRSDGAKVFNADVRISGNVVLGETQISDIKNPEYMSLELDSESKVLGGRKSDGKKFENIGYETPAHEVSFEDKHEYLEVVTDSEGKITGGRKSDGTKVEYAGLEVKGPLKINGENYEDTTWKNLAPNKEYINNFVLPSESCNCLVRFKTKQSLFRQPITNVILFSIPGILDTYINNNGRDTNYFEDFSRVTVVANYGTQGSDGYISRYNSCIRSNIYGKDLFSIRIKYPVVTGVDANGEATITEYMPERLQGAYLRKTDSRISVFDGNNVELWGYNAANNDMLEPIIDAMIAATGAGEALEDFEIIKYGCEGNKFGDIIPAIYENKIYLSKELYEVDYHQRLTDGWVGLGHPMPSGSGANGSTHKWHMDDVVPNGEGRKEESFGYEDTTITDVFRTYWDSYPTIIKTTDIGYEHYVRFNYHVKDGKIEDLFFSFDGFAWNFNTPQDIPIDGLRLLANTDLIDVTDITISPYKEIFTPAICMLHKIITSNIPDGDKNNITYQRLYDILSYFRKKKFSNISLDEAISSIDGGRAIDRPVYCLTFDDYRRQDTWQDDKVRTLLEMFDVKVSWTSLWTPEALYVADPPQELMTSKEYTTAKNSGWTIFPHGIGQYNPYFTYAQFINAWIGIKDKWNAWYGEIPRLYGNHSNSMKSHQIDLMKHLGYTYIHGTAYEDDNNPLLEAGASFIYGSVYPRFHIRGESYNTWEVCKERIDSLSPKTGHGVSKY